MTRQNAGKFFTEAGGAVAPGGMNAPAATGCADVMVVSGSFNVARLSQVAAKDGVAREIKSTSSRQGLRVNRFTSGSIAVNQNHLPQRTQRNAEENQKRAKLTTISTDNTGFLAGKKAG
jgi:hypothetical protein